MRVLTVRQPWAWAIVHGGKDVENRSRNVAGAYRGPVAIHAGLRDDAAAYDDQTVRDALGRLDSSWELLEQLETGVVLGVVDLVEVHQARYTPDLGQGLRGVCCTSPWAQSDAGVHLVLANPRPFPRPIPAKGRLGLWHPDEQLLTEIADQTKEPTCGQDDD